MKKLHIAALAAVGLLAVSASPAFAAVSGWVTANVNQRSGPSTSYPPITVIPAGSSITIYGCLNDDSWCDISWGANRGWMSAAYLQANSNSHRVAIRGYSAIPFVTFNFNSYWNSNYSKKPFYSQRSKWSGFNWQKGQMHTMGTSNPPSNPTNPPNPQFTGTPPNTGTGNSSNFGKTFGKGSGNGSGNGQSAGNGQSGKNNGKNCKMVNGKWVCT